MRSLALTTIATALFAFGLAPEQTAQAHLPKINAGILEILETADGIVVGEASDLSRDGVAADGNRSLQTNFLRDLAIAGRSASETFILVSGGSGARYAAGERAFIAFRISEKSGDAGGSHHTVHAIGGPREALRLSPLDDEAKLQEALAATFEAVKAKERPGEDLITPSLWNIVKTRSPRFSLMAAFDLRKRIYLRPIPPQLEDEIERFADRSDLPAGLETILRSALSHARTSTTEPAPLLDSTQPSVPQ